MGPDPLWIPFLAIPLGIATVLTLIITLHRAKMRELDQRHRERLAAIEKGLDPGLGSAVEPESPRVPDTVADERPPPRYLLRGLMWLGIGLAFVISSGQGGWPSLPGWIAAAVGGAYVAYYLLEGRRPPPARPPQRPQGNGTSSQPPPPADRTPPDSPA